MPADKSCVFLTSPSGAAQFSIAVLCDGQPCAASSHWDPGTQKNAVRFVSPRAGELRVEVRNLGLPPACIFRVHKAELLPGEAWQPRHLENDVNLINCLLPGDSYSLRRDETTGCAVRVEPRRNARGRPVRDPQALAPDIPRTKWLLRVAPTRRSGLGQLGSPIGDLGQSKWLVADYARGSGAWTLCVRTPRGTPELLVVARGETVASIKLRLSEALGVHPDHQLLASSSGVPLNAEDTLGDRPPWGVTYAYFCDRRALLLGPLVWVFVATPRHGTLAVHCKPTDKIGQLTYNLRRLHGLPECTYPLAEFALFRGPCKLDPRASLANLQVTDLCVLSLEEVLPMKLYFEGDDGSKLSFHAKKSDRIAEVKNRIEKRLGGHIFHCEFNGLFYGDRELADESSLELERVPALSRLHLKDKGMVPLSVRVGSGPLARSFVIRVDANEPVESWRRKVNFKIMSSGTVDFRTGRRPAGKGVLQGALFLHDTLLDELTILQTLPTALDAPLCFKRRTTKLPPGSMRVVVNTFTKKSIDIWCEPWYLVLDAKLLIQELEGIAVDQQQVFYAGKSLHSFQTLDSYAVRAGSVIDVQWLRGVGGDVPCNLPGAAADGEEAAPSRIARKRRRGRAADAVVGKIVPGAALAKPRSRVACFTELEHCGTSLQLEVSIDPSGVWVISVLQA